MVVGGKPVTDADDEAGTAGKKSKDSKSATRSSGDTHSSGDTRGSGDNR